MSKAVMKSGSKLVLISVCAGISLALAGCNVAGIAELDPASSADAVSVQALADPRGVTGPGDDVLEAAKEQYRERNFGLAEQKFRAIVEKDTNKVEGWLGLAASYDQLRRFELADRAYEQVAKLSGATAILHNNKGYSYLLRGDRARARAEFAKARRLDSANPYVRNNLAAMSQRP